MMHVVLEIKGQTKFEGAWANDDCGTDDDAIVPEKVWYFRAKGFSRRRLNDYIYKLIKQCCQPSVHIQVGYLVYEKLIACRKAG